MDIEQQLIGALLQGPADTFEWAHVVLGLQAQDFTQPAARLTFQTLHRAYQDKLELSPLVVRGLQPQLDIEWLYEAQRHPASHATLTSVGKLMVQKSEKHKLQRDLDEARVLLDSDYELPAIRQHIVNAAMTHRGVQVRDASALGILESAYVEANEQFFLTPTYLDWLDVLLGGGLRSKRMIAIGGKQKGRKSSVLRNILLGLARDDRQRPNTNVSIALLNYENDRVITYFDFVAMLAAEWVWKHKHWNKPVRGLAGEPKIQDTLNAEKIQRIVTSRQLERWDALQQQAITYALTAMNALPLYIYDSEPMNGNLKTLDDLQGVAQLHRFRDVKPHQHYILAVDYAQLVGNGGTDYDDMRAFSTKMLELAQTLNCTVLALTQFNEAYNKDRASGIDDNYIGTKGGGTLEATVQSYLVTHYDEDRPHEITLKMARQRRGQAGKRTKTTFPLHPVTGWMLPPSGDV